MVEKHDIVKGLKNPVKAWVYAQKKIREPVLRRMGEKNDGMYVMDRDWDNLIILDACRYDTFKKYNSVEGQLKKKVSRGETTARFIDENFSGREFYDTVYVCGNAAVGNKIEQMDVYKFIGLWTDQDLPHFDRTFRDVVPPELVVEETLTAQETYPNKRLVAHFLQPHPPFIVKDGEYIEPGSKFRDFTEARMGKMDRDEIMSVYEENVEHVLKHVQELVEALDGKTVVTADHGEIIGEGVPTIYELFHPRWSYFNRQRFDYAHYDHIRLPELIEVPWLEIESGERRGIIDAEAPEEYEINEDIVEDRLEVLGYK